MMGRGIVHPVDMMGNQPWSEDLLDYLAVYLAIRNTTEEADGAHCDLEGLSSEPALQTKEPLGEGYVFRGRNCGACRPSSSSTRCGC